jgi:hypothetical protein
MPENTKDESPLEQGRRDTELKEQTHVRGSLGVLPSGDGPKVTPDSDEFGKQPGTRDEKS